MKRVLLLVLVIGLLAGQASAGLYVPSHAAMESWGVVEQDDALSPLSIFERVGGTAVWVSGPATDYNYKFISPGPPVVKELLFSGDVGFTATIEDSDKDGHAFARIGGTAVGRYEGFRLYVENDDQSTWRLGLWARDDGGNLYLSTTPDSSMTPYKTEGGDWITLPFGKTLTDPQVGFEIYQDLFLGGQYTAPSVSDTWYVSTAPLPAGILLGFLGLGAAGVGLRKLA